MGEIARQTKAVGGYLNAATIYDHTSYYTVLPSSSFAAGLDVQFDAYANSLIDEEELARELEVIIQEAKRKADNPGAVATDAVRAAARPASHPSLAHRTRARLRALTRESMLRFYRNFYHPGNTVLVVVGDVDPDEAMREIAAHAALPSGTPRASPARWRKARWGSATASWPATSGRRRSRWAGAPPTLDDATPGLDVLATILGTGRASRLRAVRERKLASSVSAYDYTPTSLGVFVIHASHPRSARRRRRGRSGPRCATSASTASARPSSREPSACTRRDGYAGSRTWRDRRTTSPNGRLGDWELGDDYLRRALSVTTDDIQALARRFLDPDQAGVIVYRRRTAPRSRPMMASMRSLLDGAPAARVEPIAASPLVVPAIVTGLRAEREEAACTSSARRRGSRCSCAGRRAR